MFAVQNAIGIKFGILQGTAEGPIGIGAMLVIVVAFAIIFCRRNPSS
jgi:uncharacterized integral membrane protein